MIKEIHLQNWKSFEKSTLYIDPLTFIIGTNASGKSNILDALYFLCGSAKGIPLKETREKVLAEFERKLLALRPPEEKSVSATQVRRRNAGSLAYRVARL